MKNHLVRMTFTVEAALVIEVPDSVSDEDEVEAFVEEHLNAGTHELYAAIGEGDEWYPVEVTDEGEFAPAFGISDITLDTPAY